MMAIEGPHALNGCHVLIDGYDRYEDYLVTRVEPDHDLRMSMPLLAERFCRLKRLCDAKAFTALALIWKESVFVTDAQLALAGLSRHAAGPLTSRLLAVALAASDRVERARACYERALGGSASTAKSGMYRQRVTRLLEAAEAFGLVELEDENDEVNGKPCGKRVYATSKLDDLMLAVGKDIAMLAAARFQSGNGLSSSGDPGADGNR
jgi:hypothetical protein